MATRRDKAREAVGVAENKYNALLQDAKPADPQGVERAAWNALTVSEKNARIAEVIDAVFVRRSSRRGRHATAEGRVRIFWRGNADRHGLFLPSKGRPALNIQTVEWPDPQNPPVRVAASDD